MIMVKTRFAPSPTGRMHVGNLRTALYSYLIARHADGTFMLRIEDTDQERYVEGAVDIIMRTLAYAGLTVDEGPDRDGGVGPYVQSERVAAGIYKKYAEELIKKGEAYYCFCTKERLESLKTEDGYAVYDKHCLSLTPEEIQANLDSGMPYVVRLNVPNEGTTTFRDEIYGDISVDNAELDDMILIKSDGYPTYNFANVIDDHLMGITHVVRGNEYLASSPKYNRIYDAFGWEVPVYVHCPLITDETHAKLSKRSGHSSFEDLLDIGFLPEAIVNYTALLGWNPPDNEEMMSLDELIKKFDYRKINKSPAVFDMGKLRWMNGEYIKAMDADAFYEKALPYIAEAVPEETIDRHELASLAQSRIETFCDIGELLGFFHEVPEYDVSLYTHKKMKTTPELSLEVLKKVQPFLEGLTDYSNDALFASLSEFAKENGWKNGQVMWPVRTAVSGKAMTPGGATQLLSLLGKEESQKRIGDAVQKLGEALS
ncbi:MAG: glutamate--tRNA ligase [Lachnospiraceae bacterium]|nr:glutamate--tRNA ligase [Lachnospiraceae bacterium]